MKIDYNLLKGKFITFEGIEGSGKSTQIVTLETVLKNTGLDVILTREPGGTRIGDQVRKILLNPENTGLFPMAELLLYQAARAQHIGELIYPAIQHKSLVLCDRFSDATIAYQGYGRGLDISLVEKLTDLAVVIDGEKIKPNLTLLFDLDAKIGLARARGREATKAAGKQETRFENEELEFHKGVRQGYLDLAKKEPERFRIIDADQSIETIHEDVVRTLEHYVESV